MIKRALLASIAVIILLLIIGLVLPNKFHIERSIGVQAPPRVIFLYLGELQKWKDWSPWVEQDPAMLLEYSSPSYGPAATYTWKSEKLGDGSARIAEFEPDKTVSYELNYKELGDSSQSRITLSEYKDGTTTVTWTMDGQIPRSPIAGYMNLFMDGWVGKDLEKGLTKLKGVSEGTDPSFKAPWEVPPEPPKEEAAPSDETPKAGNKAGKAKKKN